jgi:hypothetical protein
MDKEIVEQLKEIELRRATFHEAGHYIVAEHYGLEGFATVYPGPDGGTESKFYVGQFRYDLSDATILGPYKMSVIGWAGVVAEGLAEMDLQQWKDNLQVVIDSHCYGDDMSPTDWGLVDGYKENWRTFNRAARIIERRHLRLREIAERLKSDALNPTK